MLPAGVESKVPAREVVPRDVILLRTGDRVPADARLIETVNLQIEEAALTGESVPVEKFVKALSLSTSSADDIPLGDRKNAQRRLEIARSLASKPKLLLLDEPTAGMNPRETQETMLLIRKLRDELGITILLIEHQMRVVMGISELITVLDYGAKIAEGVPAEIQRNATVIEAYLGRGSADGVMAYSAPNQSATTPPSA